MKQILYIAPFSKQRYKGGITRIAEYLSMSKSKLLFKKNNIELCIFNSHVLNQKKNSDGKFSLQNIEQAIYFLLNLIKRIIINNFDAIHINSSLGFPLFRDQLIIYIISFFTSKKVFFQIHYSGIEETFLKNKWLRKFQFSLLSNNYCVILLSDNFRQQLSASCFQNTNIIVLHNFHIINDIQYSHSDNVNPTLRLIFVGSINQRKGFPDLLEALKTTSVKYTLDVLGDFSSDEIEIYCKRQIALHKLNIIFHGYIDGVEKEKFLINADVLILPSYAEGFPMVIPEAMAYCCAIISTQIAGIPEIVKDDYNGFLVKPGEIDLLKEKILYLNDNRDILLQFKKNSFELSTNFNLEKYIDKLSSIYNSYPMFKSKTILITD